MSDRELDEITEIRLLLEPPVVGDVAGTVPPSGIKVLRSLADAIVDAARGGDLTAYLAADREFHAELLRHSPATASLLSWRLSFGYGPACTA